jgi:hypothetical protein
MDSKGAWDGKDSAIQISEVEKGAIDKKDGGKPVHPPLFP